MLESNKFEANLNFDQVAFGLHSLVPYSEDSFKSRILIGENQARDLINLCEFNLTDKWTWLESSEIVFVKFLRTYLLIQSVYF